MDSFSQASLDGTVVVNGVTRIAFPGTDWGADVRSGGDANATHSFVAGSENRLAVPALERLLEGDDSETAAGFFNPLVLLGSTGTGKSHLARGVVRRWRMLVGESVVQYFTAVDFARELRAARDEDRLAEFREQLASSRMLVIEDLHRMPQSAYMQRELRDTLDVLLDTGAAVLVTAQQPPAAMAQLEAGLRDRFSAGLTVRLQPPGIEARRELLQETAKARGAKLSVEQLDQLAHKVEGTVAQLQRAVAEFELESQADESLDSTAMAVDAARTPLTLKQIVGVVARYYSLTQAAIRSSARRKSLVHARGIAIYLARTLTDLSYTKIGQGLGGRDHSTVMHAARTIEKLLANDATTQQDVEELKRILTAV